MTRFSAAALLGVALAIQAPMPLLRRRRRKRRRPPRQAATAAAAARPGRASVLTAGRSTVLRTDFDIVRIAVTNPAIADAAVVQTREILVDGKAPGTVSLIIWSSTDRKHYDLVVEPAITTLQQQLRALFPGEDITVSATDEAIILSGAVSSNGVSLRAAEIAQASRRRSRSSTCCSSLAARRASR